MRTAPCPRKLLLTNQRSGRIPRYPQPRPYRAAEHHLCQRRLRQRGAQALCLPHCAVDPAGAGHRRYPPAPQQPDGAYSAGNAITAFRGEGKFEYIFGAPGEAEVGREVGAAIRAAKVKYDLRRLKMISIGHTPQGFGFGPRAGRPEMMSTLWHHAGFHRGP